MEASRRGVHGVPTPDFGVRGIGKFDVDTPLATSKVDNVVRQIAKKSKRQARRVLLQFGDDASDARALEIIGKTLGKRDARRIQEIYVQVGADIVRFSR
ncbi:MAG: hypothetical protein KC766_05900 [Myxococcales bacterium]|nr:hypothetical protein [Myxococcales bacterium]